MITWASDKLWMQQQINRDKTETRVTYNLHTASYLGAWNRNFPGLCLCNDLKNNEPIRSARTPTCTWLLDWGVGPLLWGVTPLWYIGCKRFLWWQGCCWGVRSLGWTCGYSSILRSSLRPPTYGLRPSPSNDWHLLRRLVLVTWALCCRTMELF